MYVATWTFINRQYANTRGMYIICNQTMHCSVLLIFILCTIQLFKGTNYDSYFLCTPEGPKL